MIQIVYIFYISFNIFLAIKIVRRLLNIFDAYFYFRYEGKFDTVKSEERKNKVKDLKRRYSVAHGYKLSSPLAHDYEVVNPLTLGSSIIDTNTTTCNVN